MILTKSPKITMPTEGFKELSDQLDPAPIWEFLNEYGLDDIPEQVVIHMHNPDEGDIYREFSREEFEIIIGISVAEKLPLQFVIARLMTGNL